MIAKLDWPANSPDFNAIEPTWFWMKRETTKNGPINSNTGLRNAWIQCWDNMPQEKIQAWIERIPIHIQEVIKCDGNNLYKKGRMKGRRRREFIRFNTGAYRASPLRLQRNFSAYRAS
jgi:hypothetical protein